MLSATSVFLSIFLLRLSNFPKVPSLHGPQLRNSSILRQTRSSRDFHLDVGSMRSIDLLRIHLQSLPADFLLDDSQ